MKSFLRLLLIAVVATVLVLAPVVAAHAGGPGECPVLCNTKW